MFINYHWTKQALNMARRFQHAKKKIPTSSDQILIYIRLKDATAI
jgi:hypothetical protein